MEIQLDPESDVPLYQQLRDRMVEAIATGSLVPGEQLASVRQLGVAFGINVATVGKAYELLRDEGLISTSHKSRSVVARGPVSGPAAESFVTGWAPRLTTLLAEASAQGLSRTDISAYVDDVLGTFASELAEHPATSTPPRNETDPTA